MQLCTGSGDGAGRSDGAFRREAERALDAGVYLNKILEQEEIIDRIARSKYIHENEIEKIDQIAVDLKAIIDELIKEGGVLDA